MAIIEVIPGAVFSDLTVKRRDGGLNGEICWRCEDEKGRSIVLPESEIIAKYDPVMVTVEPATEPEMDSENADEEAVATPEEETTAEPEAITGEADEVPGGAAVAQPEPEKDEKPKKRKSLFGRKNKNK